MRLTLYSRAGCHLCDEMKQVLHQVRRQVTFELDEVDLSTDPNLERHYGEQIPVLLVDGRKIAKFRITQEELRRRLSGTREG